MATPYQPVMVEKKKDFNGSFTILPMKYGSLDLTYALTDHLAIRTTGTGSYVFADLSGSIIYYNTFKKLNYFVAPIFSYQNNQVERDLGNIFGTQWKTYQYNCVYNSPGMVFGTSFKFGNSETHHFNLKTQYNMVENYNYDFRRYDRYEYFLNEQLNYMVPNFFSFEPSYSLVVTNEKNNGFYKIQLGFLFTQKTLKHTYHYNWIAPYTSTGSLDQPVRTSYHPQSFLINLSFSYIFK
ncbi:MAG: hypothetical protein ACK50A_15740 [Sphingobacteriaceae bacterium]